jgi:predicted nucleic acid-binding protein
MSLPVAFWDSSALIPLCSQQIQTERATGLFAVNGVAVWWATSVEIVSGLTRLRRMGEVGEDDFLAGKEILQIIAATWVSVRPSAKIASKASSLLEIYPLRAADALQLAAAWEWCEGKPKGRVFLTFDQRLGDAAAQAGFTLK